MRPNRPILKLVVGGLLVLLINIPLSISAAMDRDRWGAAAVFRMYEFPPDSELVIDLPEQQERWTRALADPAASSYDVFVLWSSTAPPLWAGIKFDEQITVRVRPSFADRAQSPMPDLARVRDAMVRFIQAEPVFAERSLSGGLSSSERLLQLTGGPARFTNWTNVVLMVMGIGMFGGGLLLMLSGWRELRGIARHKQTRIMTQEACLPKLGGKASPPLVRPPLVSPIEDRTKPIANGPRIELFGDRDVFAIEFEVVSIMEWSSGTKDLEGFAAYWVGGQRFGYRDVGPQPLSEWLHGLEELCNFDFSENAEYLVECSPGELVSRVFNGCYWPGAADKDFAESMRRHDLTSIATRALDGLCVIAVDHGETSSIYAVGEEPCKRLRAYKPVPSESVVVVQLPRAEKDKVLKAAYAQLVEMLREVGHPG